MSKRNVPCPNCGEPAVADKSNPWRPFCSRRCKLIDLGEWLHEEHHIPGEAGPADNGEPWDTPPDNRH